MSEPHFTPKNLTCRCVFMIIQSLFCCSCWAASTLTCPRIPIQLLWKTVALLREKQCPQCHAIPCPHRTSRLCWIYRSLTYQLAVCRYFRLLCVSKSFYRKRCTTNSNAYLWKENLSKDIFFSLIYNSLI